MFLPEKAAVLSPPAFFAAACAFFSMTAAMVAFLGGGSTPGSSVPACSTSATAARVSPSEGAPEPSSSGVPSAGAALEGLGGGDASSFVGGTRSYLGFLGGGFLGGGFRVLVVLAGVGGPRMLLHPRDHQLLLQAILVQAARVTTKKKITCRMRVQ